MNRLVLVPVLLLGGVCVSAGEAPAPPAPAPATPAAQPATPAAADFVYEGQSAAEWVKKLTGDERRDYRARRALRSLGAFAFPAMLDGLRTMTDETVLTAITQSIQRTIAGNPQGYLETVQSWLKDPHAQVRAAAIKLLAGMNLKDAVSIFMPMLKDPSEVVRTAAVRALEPYGAEDPGVISTLIFMLKDAHFEVRRSGVLALARFGAGNKEIAAALTERLQDHDKAVADAASVALRTMETMAQVEAKFREGDMNQAHELVEKVRAIDPAHARANDLHDKIRERMRGNGGGGGPNRQAPQQPQRPPRPPEQNF
jgi:hypothetical protein